MKIFRPKSNLHKRMLSHDMQTNIVDKSRRYFSNPRAKSVTKPPVIGRRLQLIEISKQKGMALDKFENSLLKNNRRANSRYIYDYGKKCTHINKNSEPMKTLEALDNNSLVIESLTAVPKVSKLSPIRERLLRLFQARPKSQFMKDQSANQPVIRINCDVYKSEDNDSPSPYFKSKYKHYSENARHISRNP